MHDLGKLIFLCLGLWISFTRPDRGTFVILIKFTEWKAGLCTNRYTMLSFLCKLSNDQFFVILQDGNIRAVRLRPKFESLQGFL